MASGGGRHGGRHGAKKGGDDPDVRLSKALSYICRHGAEKKGLTVKEGGFIAVDEILELEEFRKKNATIEDIERVVTNNDKQRFALKDESGALYIRANQGHTMEVVDLELKEIASAVEAPVVVHGTYLKAFDAIKRHALSRMKRTHIHFAVGVPGDSQVISGMRSSCQVLIFINLEKALKDGYKFYRSANNVVLCPGNKDGFLPTQYFERAEAYPSGRLLPL